jgi:hypothetical protein
MAGKGQFLPFERGGRCLRTTAAACTQTQQRQLFGTYNNACSAAHPSPHLDGSRTLRWRGLLRYKYPLQSAIGSIRLGSLFLTFPTRGDA